MSTAADEGEMSAGARSQPVRVRIFGRTDVGQIREHNEDNFVVANLTTGTRGLMAENRVQEIGEKGTLLGVCDGMGGAAAGEVASQLAVDLIYERLAAGGEPADGDEFARRLVKAVEEAGARIFNEARADRSRRGMGTTATVAALLDSRLFVAQVGDSRAYVLREGQLVQVSRDQSLVNQLIEAGQLTEEEAETFEHNNIILQALGTSETVQVDLTYVDLRKGDTLLLCSDGLSGMIRADEIREVLYEVDDPLDACRQLTERANAAGGHDNITVIVARFDEGLDEPTADDSLGYQKYAIRESIPVESGERVSTLPGRAPEPSEEAARETRKLRVSHTMVGTSPLAGTHSDAPPAPRTAGDPAGTMEEPVELPTTGLSPSAWRALAFAAVLAVTFLGFLLFR